MRSREAIYNDYSEQLNLLLNITVIREDKGGLDYEAPATRKAILEAAKIVIAMHDQYLEWGNFSDLADCYSLLVITTFYSAMKEVWRCYQEGEVPENEELMLADRYYTASPPYMCAYASRYCTRGLTYWYLTRAGLDSLSL